MTHCTLSYRTTKYVLHAVVIAAIIALAVLIMSARAFAVSGLYASGMIEGTGGVNLRKSASTSSDVVTVMPDGTELTIYREVFKSKTSTAKTKKWYYVSASGVKGYVRADCVSNVRYPSVKAKVTRKAAYRKGPGTRMKKRGSLKKGKSVRVYLKAYPVKSTKGKSKTWYKIKVDGKYVYMCSADIEITGKVKTVTAQAAATTESASADPSQSQVDLVLSATSNAFSKMTSEQFENYLTRQGFPESYKKSLRKLHAKHPSWVYVARKTGMSWSKALDAESKYGLCVIYKSYPTSYRSSGKQTEPGWYSAKKEVIAYYLDPRNFLNEDRIYMFEDLSYQSDYQTKEVVNKIISPTKLPNYGFTAKVFMNAGKKNNISPVFLAVRVRQETGGNSGSVNGSKSGGTVVYNPFNIHAYGSDPVAQGLAYAKKMGWTTPTKAVNGGAAFLADGYINNNQNTIYFQKFNVANGASKVGTHQYMANVMAPYSEAHITKTTYSQLGITSEPLGFIIPVYTGMPSKTALP